MSIFATLIKKKGAEIFKDLIQSRVLFRTIAILPLVGFSKKSLEIVRLNNSNVVLSRLRRKYKQTIKNLEREKQYSLSYNQRHNETSNKIWICWFQGLDAAPHVVQECIASVKKHLADREVVVLTDDNYHHYLFLFQNLKPGLDGQALAISNWFITASYSNHPLLNMTKDLLYDYWKNHNGVVDYFIFHHFFQLAIEEFPEYWSKVVPFNNSTPHILQLRLFEEFDEVMYGYILEQTPFHKLTYKFEEEKSRIPNTYYKHLF